MRVRRYKKEYVETNDVIFKKMLSEMNEMVE